MARRGIAQGMRVLWYDIFDDPPADAPAAERRTLRRNMLAESDFVSVHTDLNPEFAAHDQARAKSG